MPEPQVMTSFDNLVRDLQEVLDRHRAAIFFPPEGADVWMNGNPVGQIDHNADCNLEIKERTND